MLKPVVLTVGLAVALTACSHTNPGTPTSTSKPPTSTVQSAATPTSAKAAPKTSLGLIDVVADERRIEFVFTGAGVPGYRIQYTDNPMADGSGHPVSVAGTSVLEVSLSGIATPGDPDFRMWTALNPLPGKGKTTEVHLGPVYEGYLTAFIGTNQTKPKFTVETTTFPPTLTIKFAD